MCYLKKCDQMVTRIWIRQPPKYNHRIGCRATQYQKGFLFEMMDNIYNLLSKLRECIVFSRFCLSVCARGDSSDHYPWCIGPYHTRAPACPGASPTPGIGPHCRGTSVPAPPPPTYSDLLNLDLTVQSTNLFIMKHVRLTSGQFVSWNVLLLHWEPCFGLRKTSPKGFGMISPECKPPNWHHSVQYVTDSDTKGPFAHDDNDVFSVVMCEQLYW